jgi:hypothetical protein
VYNAREVAEDSQEDVEQELGSASDLEEDAEWGEDDGEDDLADVARGERHDGGVVAVACGWCFGMYCRY